MTTIKDTTIIHIHITRSIQSIHRLISAISEHIAALHILTGKDVAVRVDIALSHNIIVSRLQIVETCFLVYIVSAIPDRVDHRYVVLVGYFVSICIQNRRCLSPRVVDVTRKQVALSVVNLIHVAGKGATNNVVRRNACRVFILDAAQHAECIVGIPQHNAV